MKLLHVPFCFYPDVVGGTEIYVAGLAREQLRLGHQITICAPALSDAAYVHEGLPVRRFAINPNVTNIADLYDAGDIDAAHRFGKILDAEQPDVVHLHAFTRGVSLPLVHEAKVRGIATVFSYHTPTVSCMRGTLLRNGTDVCDGLLNVRTCASCNLNNLGVPQPVSGWLASLPPNAGRAVSQVAPAGAVTTALRMTELVNLRHNSFRALTQDVDRLVALCKWTRDLLVLNGVPSDKISLSRQGISLEPINAPPAINPHSELRIAFLGRLSPEKGLPILMKAFREIPSARVTLDVYGISQDLEKPSKPIAIHDSRIKFHEPLLRSELIGTLQTYDLIAVPSQWLETGPMVVMEAFAAGIPVIGSRLGGIAELVDDNVNGLLIEPNSVQDWAAAINTLARDRALLARLRAGITRQRTMREAAREVQDVYAQIVPQTNAPRQFAAMAGVC